MGAKENAVVDALAELAADIAELDTSALEAAVNTNGARNMGEGTLVLKHINDLKALIAGQTAHASAIAANLS